LEKKEQYIIDLEERIVKYDVRIDEYEDGERKMLDEVGQIKKTSEMHTHELYQLMEERNNDFVKIQKIKES